MNKHPNRPLNAQRQPGNEPTGNFAESFFGPFQQASLESRDSWQFALSVVSGETPLPELMTGEDYRNIQAAAQMAGLELKDLVPKHLQKFYS